MIEKNNNMGTINISLDVVATIAGGAATECYGVVGMASKKRLKDGYYDLLRKENYSKGIVARNGDPPPPPKGERPNGSFTQWSVTVHQNQVYTRQFGSDTEFPGIPQRSFYRSGRWFIQQPEYPKDQHDQYE